MNLSEILTNSAPDWSELLQREIETDYFKSLEHFIRSERSTQTVFPAEDLVFEAFHKTPVNNLKAVILGQDPYHGDNQANGLCFSVPPGMPFPPSLRNIFKELKDDLKIELPMSGDLNKWATEGVLLLNTTLTVRRSIPGSHQGKGWERFTDQVIKTISERKNEIVFILWGGAARKKKALINSGHHLILEANHPSPLSANRGGFFGCRHFSKANIYLQKVGKTPIDWTLP